MGKGKPRWYPDKPQNNRGAHCPRYEEHENKILWGGGIDTTLCGKAKQI